MKTSTKINYKSEVMQICGGSGGSSSSPIQLDISKISADEGQTTYYGTSNNMMKVTKGPNVTVGGGFDFYIHSLLNGGPFTLSKEIKYASGTTSTLPEGPIPNVSEVYFYKKGDKGALKIKTSNDTKIFYSTTINTGSEWINQATTAATGELRALVTKIKEDVEINVEKTTY